MRSLPYISVMALTVLAGACKKPAPKAAAGVPDFHNPADPGFAQQAPDSFRVRSGFYDGVRFFRVIPGFMAQFGIHGDTGVTAAWRARVIQDDPVRGTNGRGMVTYATAGPATRTTQIFINFGDNNRLDASGFAPFGQVVEGMEVVDGLYGGYGEGAPNGRGPDQYRLNVEGEKYLARQFPKLDKINRATVE